MWETNSYCDVHDSYWNDDFRCECHSLREEEMDQAAQDRETDYQIDLWKERLRG